MSTSKLLSVVIPTYNMEMLLPRCLDSLVDPDVIDYLDILVVNDGSKDSSLIVARQYEEKYKDSIRVIDKTNGNYGSCVNRGIELAVGKYFRILDADDLFDKNGLLQLVSFLKNTDVDLVITNYVKEDIDQDKREVVTIPNTIESGHSYLIDEIDVFQGGLVKCFVMHAMTYKLSVVRASGLKHLEGISYTDSEYCYYPISHVNSIAFLDVVLYRYQIGREGQTVSVNAFIKGRDNLNMIINRILDHDKEFFDGKDIARQNIKAAIFFTVATYYYYIILCFVGYNDIDNGKLRGIDSKVQQIQVLDNRLKHYKVFGINPIIKRWRKNESYFNGSAFKLLHRLVNLIKVN